jgi:hypothetical protein
MPQLDQFPLLFQFKSFILGFGFIYFVFLFFVLPVLHGILRTRKVFWFYINLIGIVSNLYSFKSNIFLLKIFDLFYKNEFLIFGYFENYYFNTVLFNFYNSRKKWFF